MPRTPSPRLWSSLALGGLTALPMAAAAQTAPHQATLTPRPTSIQPLRVQGEGGEAGEAGLAVVEDPNAAYAIRLALVDAHLRAALEAYRAGMIPEAMGLAGHPEAEVMEDLRPALAARDTPDFTDDLDAYMGAIAEEAPEEEVSAAYDALAADIDSAMRAGGTSDKAIFDAMQALVKGAAIEFSDAMEEGGEMDPAAGLEAQGFLAVARHMARNLSGSEDASVAEAGRRSVEELTAAAALLDSEGPDPSILHAAAARIELAGLRIE